MGIRAQFYGHTHWDHLRIFYEQGASNIAYVTPSVTTWVGMDPSFRVYEIDHWDNQNPTFTVLDHHTFTADVHKNRSQSLIWKKEYSAKDEYKLDSLSPESWANLVDQWDAGQNLDTFRKYYKNKYHQNLDS